MGKENIVTLRYFEDNEHFAELVNGIVFCGEQVINPTNLKNMKRDLSYPWTKKGKEIYRDSVKKYCDEAVVQIYALEHQEYIDYHMVFRNMLAEALEYDRQWQENRKRHKQYKDLKQKDELLSGMKKTDKFVPVITLVVYYGEEKWDAANSLYELLKFGNADERFCNLVENYKIHVFDYHDYDSFEMFCGELKQVFSFLKHSDNLKLLQKHLAEHEEEYYNISEASCELISTITHSKELMRLQASKKEGVDMCKALQELRQEGYNEGKEQGIKNIVTALIEDYLEEGFSKEKIMDKLINKFELTQEQAEAYFN